MSIMPHQGFAFLVMLFMMIIMGVVLLILFAKKGFKTFLIYTVVFIAILGLFRLYVARTCGPNPKDVAIMKPMAKKISEYVIKNGIPKSLKDIPGLPYELECGEVKKEYFHRNKHYYLVKTTKENAINVSITENCTYTNGSRKINLTFYMSRFLKKDFKDGSIRLTLFNDRSKTGVKYLLDYDGNTKKWSMAKSQGKNDKNIIIYSSKTDGICNPMRQ